MRHIFGVSKTYIKTPNRDQIGNHLSCEIFNKEVSFSLSFVRYLIGCKMPSEPKRKLAAIMFTDIVGYTSLMQKDEVKARKLIQRQREIMKPLIEKHRGTILQYVGDGTFITFDSAIEAVNCGYKIQIQTYIETIFLGEKLLKNVEHSIKIYSLAGEDLKVSRPFEAQQ